MPSPLDPDTHFQEFNLWLYLFKRTASILLCHLNEYKNINCNIILIAKIGNNINDLQQIK